MGQLLQIILDNLYKLWPYRIVDADEQGVLFTLGKKVTLLQPGGHFFFPGLQKIEKFVVTYQEIDCMVQSVETEDGIPISVSANLGYVIHDSVKLRLAVQDPDATLERRLRGLLGEIIEENRFENLKGPRKRLSLRLKNQLVRFTEQWGIEIVNVSLTDFVRTKPYRFFTSTQ